MPQLNFTLISSQFISYLVPKLNNEKSEWFAQASRSTLTVSLLEEWRGIFGWCMCFMVLFSGDLLAYKAEKKKQATGCSQADPIEANVACQTKMGHFKHRRWRCKQITDY